MSARGASHPPRPSRSSRSSRPLVRGLPAPSPPGKDRHLRARDSANRKIGFIAHAIVYLLGSLLVFVVTSFFVGVVVLIAWTMAILVHGFYAVLAPALRSRWIEQDLTRQRVDTDAERANAESRHARSLAELSAAIAHEIRNPITAAKSLVQQIAEDPALPENREYATVAVQELDRVERSIAHLLRFAREEPRRVGTVHLRAILDAAVGLLRERLAEHHVEVRVAGDFDDMGTLEGDPEQLRRVVANVIGNAIDALVDAGTVTPHIEIRAGQNLAHTEAWLTIADNGPGIPEEALAKVFTPFYTSKPTGTGLGLALSKKIVEEHGGSIEVKNAAPGESAGGAEFLITLPLGRNGEGTRITGSTGS